MKITLVRANNYDATPAIPRALEAASKVFSDISILAWNRHGFIDPNEMSLDPAIRLIRLVKSAPSRSLKILLLTFRFQLWIIKNLIRLRPDYVQALEIESAFPSVIYCALFRKKFIYDIRDPFALVYKHRPLIKLISYSIDWSIMALSSAIVLPNSNLESYLGRWRNLPLFIIPNTCHDHYTLLEDNVELISKINEIDGITLGYLGYMIKQRGSDYLLELINSSNNITLVVAGSVREPGLIESYLNNPKILYLGELSYLDALTLIKHVDYIPTLYDPSVPIHKDLIPTKFYEAMMAGTPIIVSEGMDLLEGIVANNKLGFSVKYNDVKGLKAKISEKHPEKKLINSNCRNYYLKNLNLSKHIEEYQRFYGSLLEN